MTEEHETTAISLFSGAGGDTLGMEQQNIRVVGYVENNAIAIQTHEHNFPNCVQIGTDITSVTDKTFRKYKGTDLLFGGFPCQSFSHGGKKNPTDSRGFLYQEFVRAANIIKPKVIIGENVKGLINRKMEDGTLFLSKIMEDFENIGYNMKYTLFNMKDFGIPQTRQRILIYGIRKDLKLKCSLENVILPTNYKYNKDIVEFSLENALEIKDIDIINTMKKGDIITNLNNNEKETGKPPRNLIKCYDNKELSFSKRSRSTYSCIIDINDFSRTILCAYSRMPRLFVPLQNNRGYYLRPYTIKELQLIQGFPYSFEFKGTYIDQINQIGNAIPPIFVKNIMSYIIGILQKEIIEL
jgi:DNA (cytosine-5)-methyltransferase 1